MGQGCWPGTRITALKNMEARNDQSGWGALARMKKPCALHLVQSMPAQHEAWAPGTWREARSTPLHLDQRLPVEEPEPGAESGLRLGSGRLPGQACPGPGSGVSGSCGWCWAGARQCPRLLTGG